MVSSIVLCAACAVDYREQGKHLCWGYFGVDKCECEECNG